MDQRGRQFVHSGRRVQQGQQFAGERQALDLHARPGVRDSATVRRAREGSPSASQLYVTTTCPGASPMPASAVRTNSGGDGSARIVPSADVPATAKDFGRRTPASTGGTTAGGNTSSTSSRWTCRPRTDTRSPASSRRTATSVSSSAASCEAGYAPIWRIHDATPWPSPPISRPGCSSASAASSIAAIAGLRATAGRTPMPTLIVDVTASAVATVAMPAAQKQSSTSQTSSRPAASAWRASSTSLAGGCSRLIRTPTDELGAYMQLLRSGRTPARTRTRPPAWVCSR